MPTRGQVYMNKYEHIDVTDPTSNVYLIEHQTVKYLPDGFFVVVGGANVVVVVVVVTMENDQYKNKLPILNYLYTKIMTTFNSSLIHNLFIC